MNKEDFYYYLHKTKINSDMIESIFSDGLKSWYGTSIHSTLYQVPESDIQSMTLDEIIKNYLGSSEEYDSVVVAKIPKKYMCDRIHRDGKIDPPVPMWKNNDDNTTTFTSDLIQGIYCRDINKSFTNPNFSPVYDPSGLVYSDEQIQSMWGLNLDQWINFAKARSNGNYESMLVADKSANTWNKIISHYSQIYGTVPTQKQNFCLSDEDKRLFSSKTL